MKTLGKFACRSFVVYLFIFGLIPPVIFGVFNTGVAVMLIFALLLLLVSDGWRFIPTSITPSAWVRTALAAALAVSFALGAGLSVLMIKAAYFTPPPAESEQTVVVLGCQTIGGKPSLMLSYRLDAAYAQLEPRPDIPVVVTGGWGNGETEPEAVVMKSYLRQLGIDDKRIHSENEARNTSENLEFSAEMIREKSLPDQAVIVTDGFHQLRSAYFAKQNGLTPYSLPSKTPWGLLPSYWVREFFGIFKAVFM